jgi:Holliday junction resolvase-like predicted endonuclease|tara:strand:+ start:283 stop:609 length:327 start_codon:yes stop_codon:yes gene_type:complete
MNYKEAERLAGIWLESNQHIIIARNYRMGRSEVDVISLKGDCLYLNEVKYRSSAVELIEDLIDQRQINRIICAGNPLLHRYQAAELKVILIHYWGNSEGPKVFHVNID